MMMSRTIMKEKRSSRRSCLSWRTVLTADSVISGSDQTICSQTHNSRPQNGCSASRWEDPTHLHEKKIVHNNVAGNPDEDSKAIYHPRQPASQPQMFRLQSNGQNDPFDQLQREFLDSAQSTLESQKLAQLQVMHKAQCMKTEELVEILEESRRRTRFLEHQLHIVKEEKEGLVFLVKKLSALIEEAKKREDELQERVRALEEQNQSLSDKVQEAKDNQRCAEIVMEKMVQQMSELCSSETLTQARQQHDSVITAIKKQYEAQLLVLQQQLDLQSHSLAEQTEARRNLLEQVRQLHRQREKEQLDRASIFNVLTQRLEESQQQCAKLLEKTQQQIELQETQMARTMNEELNKALQMEVKELNEQIFLYESAVNHEPPAKDSKIEKSSERDQTDASHKELIKLREELKVLQERVEALEKRNHELKLKEEKVKADNFQLCTHMRNMIKEIDEEKLEAAKRNERIQQLHIDNVVHHMRAEHAAQLDLLCSQHQHQIHQLESKLAEVSQEATTVKEWYLSVCREKHRREEEMQVELDKERRMRENEKSDKLKQVLKETQELHEAEMAKMKQLECQNLTKLQKKNHILQENLEKACHHHSDMIQKSYEHAAALQEEQQSRRKVLEELNQVSRNSVSKDHLNARLEEMGAQYIQALERKQDMVQFLSESQEQLIQRERQNMASRMRI